MLTGTRQSVARVRRRGALGWLAVLSLALHVGLFAGLVLSPSAPPVASAPPSVDIVVEVGMTD